MKRQEEQAETIRHLKFVHFNPTKSINKYDQRMGSFNKRQSISRKLGRNASTITIQKLNLESIQKYTPNMSIIKNPIVFSPKNVYKKYQPPIQNHFNTQQNFNIQKYLNTSQQYFDRNQKTQTPRNLRNNTLNQVLKTQTIKKQVKCIKNVKSKKVFKQYFQNKSPKLCQNQKDSPKWSLSNNDQLLMRNTSKNFLNKFYSHIDIQHQQLRSSEQIKMPFTNFNSAKTTNQCSFKKIISIAKNQPIAAKNQSFTHFGINNKLTNKLQSSQKYVTLQDFEIGRCLGKGQTGKVFFARHKKTNTIFALKQVSIKTLKQKENMLNQFLLEIKILSYVNHPNILKFYGCFRNKDNFYLILEFMQSGQLYSLIKNNKKLNENQTAVYIRQMAQGVRYLHKVGISHRDIKPENVVISMGVCKIGDFGWATTSQERRKTSCGTLDYIAPQIIEGLDYDCSIDLWCLGVLTYQLLMGITPFYHSSRKQTMMRIVNVNDNQSNISYNQLSRISINFIQGLLQKNPQQRLKIQEVINHPFLNLQEQNVN